MFTETDIVGKAWLVTEIVNAVMAENGLPHRVEKIFVVGSYASGRANEWSDLDYLVQFKRLDKYRIYYPAWSLIRDIHKRLNTGRIHVIFGTEPAAKSLHEKHKNERKNYAYREIRLGDSQCPSTSTPC